MSRVLHSSTTMLFPRIDKSFAETANEEAIKALAEVKEEHGPRQVRVRYVVTIPMDGGTTAQLSIRIIDEDAFGWDNAMGIALVALCVWGLWTTIAAIR